jgi:hypothetical protein
MQAASGSRKTMRTLENSSATIGTIVGGGGKSRIVKKIMSACCGLGLAISFVSQWGIYANE